MENTINLDKQTAGTVQKTEERFRILAEAASEGIAIIENGRFVDVSEQYALMFRGDRVAFVGREVVSFVTPESRGAVAERIRLRSEEPYEHRGLRLDGTVIDVEVRGKEVTWEGRRVRVAAVRDITKRKRAENALKESEAFRKRVFESSRIAIVVLDAETQQCVDCNKAAVEIYHLPSRAAMLGKTPANVSSAVQYDGTPSPEKALYYNQKALTDGDVIFEWRNQYPDGGLWDAEIHLMSFVSGGHQFLQLATQNITERKRAAEAEAQLRAQLVQSQKMESIGLLAGGVAHDFNNMLQVILGNVAMAIDCSPPGHPVRDYLEEIQRSGNRSADLTRQLLAFARKQTIQPRVLDLNVEVAGVIKMLRRLIRESVQVVWEPGADLWSVKMDPSQVDQILTNLSLNSRDAISGVGKISIATRNVTLDNVFAGNHPDCVAGNYVVLSLGDDGRGMDAHTRAHVFEPYFTTKEFGKGTGLGLATIYGIVRQNHGFIEIESELGHGTTIKIYLPKAEYESMPGASESVCQLPRGSETVLLVEDEEQVLKISRRILEQQGYSVLAASSPQMALDLAGHHTGPLDLLVTDVVMPGMNGKDLLNHLRANHPGLRCLLVSGYAADIIGGNGAMDDGVHFLQKPFTILSLAENVRSLCSAARS
jgi:two-component system, cell cycle sensor histidine kinase and response regulator CckA